jgi:hypothetical protein
MRRLRLLLPIVCVVALAALAVAYRAKYGDWPGQGGPERLHWCGRNYLRDPSPSVSRRAASGLVSHPVFRAPPLVGRQVFASLAPTGVCAVTLYRHVGSDRYALYALSGGP